MKHINKILLIVFVGIIPIAVFSQYNETREFSKKFKVEPETRIEISNKYGNVEINAWEKDSVVINVKIKVEERKLSKLEKTMEGIDFDFTKSSHFLIARTIVNKTRSPLEKELLKFKESLLQTDGNVEINYTVWLPNTSDLILDNKYGDIFMSEYSGNCDITLSNGNLKAHELNGKTKINLNFADATINKIENGQINSNYSEVYIKVANSLRIESKQSTYEINESLDLDINSRRDKYRIMLADLIDADGSFSNFRVRELQDRINLRSNYGDLDIENIHPEFSNILIESKSTDINLYFDSGSNFNFEITQTKTELDFCREVEIADKTILNEKNQKIRITGNFGTKQANQEKLFINATSGKINILTN